MKRPPRGVVFFLVGSVLFGLGHASAYTAPIREHTRVVEKRVEIPVPVVQEKVVEKRVEVPVVVNSSQLVVSYHLPKSCDMIGALLVSDDDLNLKVNTEVGAYPDILSDAVRYMADHDQQALNKQIEQARALVDTLGNDQIALKTSHTRLADALNRCRQDLKR